MEQKMNYGKPTRIFDAMLLVKVPLKKLNDSSKKCR
jgi:hypothetical protein